MTNFYYTYLNFLEDYKKVYLVIYNLFQLVGFTYILTVVMIRYSRDGVKSIEGTYENVGTVMKLCHLFMWLEVLHPYFGYTKNSIWAPLMQVCDFNFLLFFFNEFD